MSSSGKVERRLGEHAQLDQRVDQRADLARERAGEAARRRARRGRRRRVDEVGDALGLREVELAVEKRALRELARPREARAELDAAREQQPQHRRAAVAVQLEHVLAGVGARRREVERDALVERLAVARRETWRASRRAARVARRTIPAMIAGTPAPGHADDADAAAAGRRGDRRDRVGRRTCAPSRRRGPRIASAPASPAPRRRRPSSGASPRRAPLPSRARGSCATAGRSAANC